MTAENPIIIKRRFSGNSLYTSNTAIDLVGAVKEALRDKANLSGADLRSADLRSANLGGADLRSADLRSANLGGADLRSANLGGADLGGANLGGANLSGADLGGADLSGADLRSANLGGADKIYSFGPIGEEKRIGYAVAHETGAMVKLGSFWGDESKALAAIEAKYGVNSDYAAQVVLACKIVMAGVVAAAKTKAA